MHLLRSWVVSNYHKNYQLVFKKKNTVSFRAKALITEADLFVDTILIPNFIKVFVNTGRKTQHLRSFPFCDT